MYQNGLKGRRKYYERRNKEEMEQPLVKLEVNLEEKLLIQQKVFKPLKK